MEGISIFLGILGAILAGAISPGASFILVCRTAISQSRQAALMAALGMGVGGAVFAFLALVGLVALLVAVPALHLALKICGGLYLFYLAYQIWRGATEPIKVDVDESQSCQSLSKIFWTALGIQLSNPKTAIVYGSIFAAFMPPNPPVGLTIVLVPCAFMVEFGWYAVVATLFSLSHPRKLYLSLKTKIDRVVGVILALLGGRLLISGMTD